MHGKGLFMAGADIRSCMVGNSRMELDFPRVQNPDTASGGMKLEKKGFPIESSARQAIACSLAQAIEVQDVLKTQC